MSTAKRLIIISIFAGIGFAVTFSIIAGGVFWYQSQPKPPKPWDINAVVASYDHIDTEGENNNIVFYYTLQNNTDLDYKIPNLSNVVAMAKLEKQKSLSSTPNDEHLKPDFPILIPARQRIRFAIDLKYPYDKKLKNDSTQQERKKYGEELERFANDKLSNLDGFVLFDERNRYQINLPNGWKVKK